MTNPKASLPPPSSVSKQTPILPPKSSRGSSQQRAQVSTPPPPSALASRVMARHAQLSRLNHFELLEAAENADEETLRRAFNQTIQKFHPDLLRDAEQRLRPLAQQIVRRIGAAYRVLENQETRREYLQSLQRYPHLGAVRSSMPRGRASDPTFRASRVPGARTGDPFSSTSTAPGARASEPAFRNSSIPSRLSEHTFRASSIPSARGSEPPFRASSTPSPRRSEPAFRASSIPSLRPTEPALHSSAPNQRATSSDGLLPASGSTPEMAFDAARIQLQRGAIEAAWALAEQACQAAPSHPQYRALYTWLRVERGELQPGSVADEILATLTWAVRQQRTNLEIRLYRARVLSRLGRREEAMRDFSVVASMDEKNLEAIREVRLYRAREEQAAANSGVLSKFFKKP